MEMNKDWVEKQVAKAAAAADIAANGGGRTKRSYVRRNKLSGKAENAEGAVRTMLEVGRFHRSSVWETSSAEMDQERLAFEQRGVCL